MQGKERAAAEAGAAAVPCRALGRAASLPWRHQPSAATMPEQLPQLLHGQQPFPVLGLRPPAALGSIPAAGGPDQGAEAVAPGCCPTLPGWGHWEGRAPTSPWCRHRNDGAQDARGRGNSAGPGERPCFGHRLALGFPGTWRLRLASLVLTSAKISL